MSIPALEPRSFALGDRVRFTITDIAFGGEGVGRIDDFVIFIPFVIIGEEVEGEIVELKKRFARARLIQVHRPSPQRVTPPCPYFGECGGCQYQHMEYATQLEVKTKQVRDLFQRIGHVPNDVVEPVAPCPEPYGYRNRIMIRSQWNKWLQKLAIGFMRHNSRLVVDINECKIAEPELSDQIRDVRENPPPKGGLKVVLRLAPEDWEVPNHSFFQNNFKLLPKMVEVVRRAFQESGARHLADIYCGVGFFAIELADLAVTYAGVEMDKMAVEAASRNAVKRNRVNGEFLYGSAEDLLPSLLERFDANETSVILDPPRRGCAEATLQLLRDVRPKQIIYVSCQPATLARDLAILCGGGLYRTSRVTPLDMFPQTQHVECVTDLRLSRFEENNE